MQMSPYTPGEVAEEVYGREPILEGIRRDLAFMTVEPRFAGRIRVFAGPRGVGKTSVLRAAQTDAERLGFQTVPAWPEIANTTVPFGIAPLRR